MKPPALGPVVYHVARHGFPTYVRQRALALATNAHLAYVQVSNSPLVQIIAFDLAVVLLSFSCIYIVLHAAYAILEQTVLGESRKTREEKMHELDEIFKAYKYSVPEDEMDEFQKDFANYARRRGYRMNGSLLPGGPSAEDDLAIAPLASVNGDVPLAAKGFRVVEVPERPTTPPPLPMFAAVISPGASSFVSLSHTSPAGNLTKAPVRIQPLARKAYTPAHTLEAIAAQEGVSEPLTSRVALPRNSLAEQPLAATINGTYELGTGLAPGETMLGTTIPAPILPLRQPSSSAGPADEFASNAPLLRDASLLVEGDALFGKVAPLAKADTPMDEIAADGLSAPVSADGAHVSADGTDISLPADGADIPLTGVQPADREQQIFIPPNASLARMSPSADPTRDIGVEQALKLPPMADSTLSLPVANAASRRRAGSTATLPAERPAGASRTASQPSTLGTAIAPPSSNRSPMSMQGFFLGSFGTEVSEEGSEKHRHRDSALVAQVNGAAPQPGTSSAQKDISSAQLETPSAEADTSSGHPSTTSYKNGALDVYAAPESDAPATPESDATAAINDDAPPPSSSSPLPAADAVNEHAADGETRDKGASPPLEDGTEPVYADAATPSSGYAATEAAGDTRGVSPEAVRGESSKLTAGDQPAGAAAEDAAERAPDHRSGHSLEDPIDVSRNRDNSFSLSEGDITLSADDDAHSDGVAQEDRTGQSILPADGRSVLPANGPRSAFDDSDEEEEDEGEEDDVEEDDEEEEEDIVDASTLHNGTLSPIAEGVDEEEEDGTAHLDQVDAVSDDEEAGIVPRGEESKAGPAHHEHVEPGVSYAAAVRGDGPVWWT